MKNKRGGVRTRSSYKKQKAGTGDGGTSCPDPDNPFEEEFGSSSDSGQGVWAELSEGVTSNLANTVVSIASFDEAGDVMFFACTGIIIKNDPETKMTSFLTSLSLARSIEDDSKIFHNMTIQVRLPDNNLELGWLNFWDLQHNLAVINIPRFHTLQVACLDNQRQFESHSKVVAVGRCFNSGKLMATAGMLTANPSGDYRAVSTCQITMTGVGGPLIDFNGDFVGMNFYAKEETPFLPRTKIIELLKQFNERVPLCAKKGPGITIKRFPIPHESDSQGSSRGEQNNKGQKPSICTLCDPECQPGLKDKILQCKRFHTRWPYSSPYGDEEKIELRSNGYPFPLWEDFRRRLVNTFEEEFGEDVSTKLKRKVASNMPQSVVALASFIRKRRCFACTGVVIESNKSTTRVLTSASLIRTPNNENVVDDKLKIVVCLPDNRHIPGTLQHYSLNYNIAVITITDFCCTWIAQINDKVQIKPCGEVVAVGRVHKSGKLIATSGVVTDKTSELSCKELVISTCKITKAGIGGPLIDFAGNLIGMNFYGLGETPYLPMNIILKLLRKFDAEGTVAIDDHISNRWPVPKPFWCYPTWHEANEEIDLDEVLAEMRVLC
ncbi:uncharacterized protein [Lolium perenne]|uniref:uncharacterized protein isoform X1 n=1 Tax=Lolium perenne TaxID=4522 RepID=UPI0021F54BF7|nr:uncharacterized protein LOC127340601 isoform X1 [Lolium perenne]XP_051222301.1 uncharacterized protein LOC127340601 isoform X1 [Lolium perenne]XP_051222302.1 uncharacterized protein LOC127340601 isoform X1 [Lolium perenne]